MVRHIHLDVCDSTQDVLKEQLSGASLGELFLISCETQEKGRGRGENIWTALPGTLCFSVNIAPHKVMSFTAIELSVIIAQFFETKHRHLKLKWPNDLWDENLKKCGGILVQGNQNNLLAGIGINLFSNDEQYGSVFPEAFNINKKELALEMASFIHAHRFSDTELLKKMWLERCGHLNQLVKIFENGETTEGVFQGIGEYGEALVCQDAQTHKIFNGSLRFS